MFWGILSLLLAFIVGFILSRKWEDNEERYAFIFIRTIIFSVIIGIFVTPFYFGMNALMNSLFPCSDPVITSERVNLFQWKNNYLILHTNKENEGRYQRVSFIRETPYGYQRQSIRSKNIFFKETLRNPYLEIITTTPQKTFWVKRRNKVKYVFHVQEITPPRNFQVNTQQQR